MKKLFCLFLALLMLTLAACDRADDTKNTSKVPTQSNADSSAESAPSQTENPWLQLKALASGMGEGIEPFSLPADFTTYPADFTGTGEIYNEITSSGDEGSLSQGMNGTITSSGDTAKIEYCVSDEGIEFPLVLWMHEDRSYLEFPTLFPESIYSAEEFPSMSWDPFSDTEIPNMGTDIFDEFLTTFEEIAAPEENMAYSEEGGVQTYRLELDGRQANALFEELNSILSDNGYSDLLEGETDIMGQLSATPMKSGKYNCDTGIFEITTDGDAYLNIKATAMYSGKVADEMEIKIGYTEDTVTYTVSLTPDKDTEIQLTLTTGADKQTIKGEIAAKEQGIKLDLTLLAKSETECTIDGTISLTMGQGGFSMAIPLNITGSFAETEERRTFEMRMDLSIMGQSMGVETGYDIFYTDTELEFPYTSANIRTYNEEKFIDRLMEVYPDLFGGEAMEYEMYFAESEDSSVILYEDGSGDLTCLGTYRQKGSSIEITVLDGMKMGGSLTVKGDKYYLNGQELEVDKEDGDVWLFYEAEDGSYPWGVTLYKDGTCSFGCAFYPAENGDGFVFADGSRIGADELEIVDAYTIKFCGIDFFSMYSDVFENPILYGSDETDIRLEVSREYDMYRITMDTFYEMDGETLTVKSFGDQTLVSRDGSVYLNGILCATVTETKEYTRIICRDGDYAVTLLLYKDGTCNVALEGIPIHEYGYSALKMTFPEGDGFYVKMTYNYNATRVTIFGKVLDIISGSSSV